jgi:hypothetical protein
MIDIGNDSSDEDEEGPVKKKQATEGGEEGVITPPLIDLVGHCDDDFYLTRRRYNDSNSARGNVRV